VHRTVVVVAEEVEVQQRHRRKELVRLRSAGQLPEGLDMLGSGSGFMASLVVTHEFRC
jgi:hypothetical protein